MPISCLPLTKSHTQLEENSYLPERMEFMGINVSQDGNRPAMSKHQLLETWPTPTVVRDIAAILGFANFYSPFISHFEEHIGKLRVITKLDYLEPVAPHFDADASVEWEDVKKALLDNPLCVILAIVSASTFVQISLLKGLVMLLSNPAPTLHHKRL